MAEREFGGGVTHITSRPDRTTPSEHTTHATRHTSHVRYIRTVVTHHTIAYGRRAYGADGEGDGSDEYQLSC